MISNTYYVYRYIRLDKNTPFYIGKGKKRRAFDIKSHNVYCNNIANKYGLRVKIFIKNLSEQNAFKKEIEFIALYKKSGFCETNICKGGQGSSGHIPWSKGKQLSESHKLNVSIGTKKAMQDPKIREKISISKKGILPHNIATVIDITSGLMWTSITEAAKIYGYNNQTLRAWLSGQNPNPTDLRKVG